MNIAPVIDCAAPSLGGGARPLGDHPPEIAFLREFGIDAAILRAAAAAGRQQGVDAAAALIAFGGVTDTLFYRSLARFLDVPLLEGWPALRPGTDARAAVGIGRVALADGRWVLAPTGAALRLLLLAARAPDLVPRRVAITTPAKLEALVLRRAGASLARCASDALPAVAPRLSARGASGCTTAMAAGAVAAGGAAAIHVAPATTWTLVGILFMAAIALRWTACAAGLPRPTRGADLRLPDAALPAYTVLVPLHHEANMAGDIVRHLGALDYPAAKLEILLLLEADDVATRAAFAAVPHPPTMRVVVVPNGKPRTKPRALNFGLALARGTLITIFDAEDRPHPRQLRRAAAAFAAGASDLACVQGRLTIREDATSILTRLFALEYAGLFDLHNPGLARLRLPLPLGGTSNHFRASALRDVGGWDSWNVTEDADLGIRLARFGFRVDVIDSPTSEEAPARLDIWMRQRRRWTKGWMQVALVLLRDPSAWRDLGPVQGGAVALMLINLALGPLATPLLLATAGWQATHGGLSAMSAALALLLPAAAIGSTLWCGVAGARARGLEHLLRFVPLLLPYQLLVCVAAWGGLLDLAVDPHGWRKTPHGVATLNRSSRAAPRPPRRAFRRWPRGSRPPEPGTA